MSVADIAGQELSPPWMNIAREQLGVRETPGPRSTPKIMGWAQKLGAKILGIAYESDGVPWCGLFCAYVMATAGQRPPRIAVRARAWALWGEDTEPCEGAVLVFERQGGGHVGFYAGETGTAYKVLGGNQGDAVSHTWIAKDRCIAVRWPQSYRPKGKTIRLTASGQLSKNEA